MSDLPSPLEITTLVGVLAPAVLIISISARFVKGAVGDLKEKAVEYAVVSLAYYAAVSPIFHVAGGIGVAARLWDFLQYFLIPSAIGVGIACANQFNVIYKIAAKLGLRIAHHILAA